MPLTFICEDCGKRFFFKNYLFNDGRKICEICDNNIRFEKRKKELDKQQEQKRSERKKLNEIKANESLRKELEWESLKQKQKQRQSQEQKEQKSQLSKEEEDQGDIPQKKIIISLEQQAIEASRHLEKVLYVFADVKHLRALEWVRGKKRVLLNKEREIRRTHKGGYSQEKFQKFVDMKKKKTPEWIEEHLIAPGILRGPYDKVIIDTGNAQLEEAIAKATKQ